MTDKNEHSLDLSNAIYTARMKDVRRRYSFMVTTQRYRKSPWHKLTANTLEDKAFDKVNSAL